MSKKVKERKPTEKQVKEFEEELLDLARVTRVVRGGRRLRFRATVAVGNGKGKVGIGTGKSAEVATAVQKAVAQAKKHFIEVPLTDVSSIPHEIKIKFKAAKIFMMPAFEGTGIKAGGVTRKILELAGVHNIIAKRFGSNAPLVNAQATILALSKIVPQKLKKVAAQKLNTEESSEVSEG